MKMIPTSRKYRCLAGFGIFLISVALLAGTIGCSSGQYVLTVRCTEGGQVASPANTSSTYGVGTVINLTAEPEEGYRFDGWTGGVSTIANVNAAVTTITINGTYSITANFVQGQEIRDWFGLNAARTSDNLGGHHRLMNDLDSTTAGYNETASDAANEGRGWQPIGTSDDQFTGSFDGHGYEIRDLFIDRSDGSVGLFGYVAEEGVIEDIGLADANVTGKNYVGGLVGWNQGTVSNSYSNSSVIGTNNYVGGLVGWNQHTVRDSHSTGSVSGRSWIGGLVGWNQDTVSNSYSSNSITGGNEHVGGLVGWNEGTVSNSYSSSNMTGSSEHVGGLVGWNDGTVSDSHSTGSVSGRSWVGGLVGWNDDTVSHSYSTGRVSGDDYVGGLVGDNPDGTVSHSYSTGSVTGDDYVGGLVGRNQRTVSNSYSSSNVTGSSEHVGGLVGWNEGTVSSSYSAGCVGGHDYVGGLVGDNHDGTVKNSYCTGNVTGDRRIGGLVGYNENSSVSDSYSRGNVTGDQYVGGLVGYNEKSSVSKSYSVGDVLGNTDFGGLVGLNNEGDVINSFWDKATSGTGQSAGGKGQSTNDMMDITTFLNAGWSICEPTTPQTNDGCTWKIIDGQTYPFLSWQSASLLEP